MSEIEKRLSKGYARKNFWVEKSARNFGTLCKLVRDRNIPILKSIK